MKRHLFSVLPFLACILSAPGNEFRQGPAPLAVFSAEWNDALSILMALLIDQNVSSLGHRFLCLSEYGRLGVSIQPHTGYGYNAVLYFYY